MRPRVLAVVRWPVGGIRTWCRYVYRNELFASMSIDMLLPRVKEAEILEEDLAGTSIRLRWVRDTQGSSAFAAEAFKTIVGGKYALIHSHGYTSALVAHLPNLIKRVRHLVTAHDVILDHQYRDFRGRIARRALSSVLGRADCVQAVSAACAANLVGAFPRAFHVGGRLVTIPNGIESDRFLRAQHSDLRSLLRIPSNGLLVGFFGRFMGQKGFRYLVDVVKLDVLNRHEQSRPIFVVAVGNDGYRKEEEIAIEAAGISERFRFLDFSPNIADLMRSMDVVAMPSLWEACGLLAMEALVAGVPLVVGDCEALSDICEGTPARIVRRGSVDGLMLALRGQDSEESRHAAEMYRASAAERFDVQRTSQGVFGLYEQLIC